MLGIKVNGKKKEDEERSEAVAPAALGVVKVIEIIGTSPTGFDDAIARAVRTASTSLRHLRGADVKHMTVAIKDGAVTEYRVDLKVAFGLDSIDDD